MQDAIGKMMDAHKRIRAQLHDSPFDSSQGEQPCEDWGLEVDADEHERDLAELHGIGCQEIGLADLQETDYPAYCRVYEYLFGTAPLLVRQAD